jgi:hypothetical protein
MSVGAFAMRVSYSPIHPLICILTLDQGQKLRVFMLDNFYVTAFEKPEHEPGTICNVQPGQYKDSNLTPSRLSLPLRRDPILRSRGGTCTEGVWLSHLLV